LGGKNIESGKDEKRGDKGGNVEKDARKYIGDKESGYLLLGSLTRKPESIGAF
jgi:hypothetical protein